MSDIIQVLPSSLSNQIAAGEVVQRPASALKELLENSLDAGAKRIDVLLRDAGKELMHVVDDGEGMNAVDARMCFAQHATSKIRTGEDLQRISTFGFRGEALAAIAAISRVELTTRRKDDETGTSIYIAKGELCRSSSVNAPKGSCFVVRNMFFNVPARRKFLCSVATEMRHIINVFQQAALSQPGVALTLQTEHANNQRKILYQLKASNLSDRIVALFGKKYVNCLLPIDLKQDMIQLSGYVGKPEVAKKTSGQQWLFVNQRYVRSRTLTHAILKSYETLISKDRYPFFLIFMEISPLQIDVNVHPAKTEIKFEDESMVYALLHAATRKSLGTYHAGGSIDFELDANFASHMVTSDKPGGDTDRSQRHKWKNLQQEVALESQYQFADGAPPVARVSALSGAASVEEFPVEASPIFPVPSEVEVPVPLKDVLVECSTKGECPFFVLYGTYLAKPVKNSLLIIDCQRAYERILYERFCTDRDTEGAAQRLMFTERMPFGQEDLGLFAEARPLLERSGFLYSLEQEELCVYALPVGLPAKDIVSLFEMLLEAFKQEYQPELQDTQKAFWRLAASRLAVRHLPLSTNDETQALIKALRDCQQPNYTPKGLAIFHYLSQQSLCTLLS